MIERDLFYYRVFIVIFWIQGCFGFVSEELLPFLIPAKSVLFLLLDMALAYLCVETIQRKKEKWIVASFFVIAIISTLLLNKLGIVTFVNGSRQFFGLMFSVPIFRYLLTCKRGIEFREKIDKQLYAFLCIQPVCIIEQAIRYGVGDHGGGTMGKGFSGVITSLIFIISFYFVSKNWDFDNVMSSLKSNKKYLLLLFPVLLNETKICFIYFAVYFLLLYRLELKTFIKIALAAPIIGVVGYALLSVYSVASNATDDTFTFSNLYEYLSSSDADELISVGQAVQDEIIETDNIWSIDLPRFVKIGLTPSLLDRTGGGMFLGAGVGQFKGGTTLELTPFARENKWAIQGSVPMMFFVIVELGIVGFAWFIYTMLNIIALKRRNDSEMSMHVKLLLSAIALLCLFYNDMYQNAFLCLVFCYVAMTTYTVPNIVEERYRSGKRKRVVGLLVL